MSHHPDTFPAHVEVEGQSDAFRLGRACFLFEKTQSVATGQKKKDKKTKINGRIAKLLCKRPAEQFGRIHARFLGHTADARGYNRFVNVVGLIMAGVDLPKRLSKKDESEFHLGYMYERTRLYMRWQEILGAKDKDDEEGEDSDDEDLPEADPSGVC